MIDFIIATKCIKRLNDNKIHMKKEYFSQIVSKGKIPFHSKPGSSKKFYKYDEVVKALENMKDPSREPQRLANTSKREEDEGVFGKEVEPIDSLATMNEDEKKKHDESLAATFSKLEKMSSNEDNDDRPGVGADGQEWNVFKTKQQALNYELDRKLKEGTLMYLDDFKATLEIVQGPLNQSLDDLAFKFKAQFPDVSDEKIQWILNQTNQMKVDVQNVTV